MRSKLTKQRLAMLLAVIGPGLVAASADNDAGGIITYSLAGARFEYTLLWVLFLVTISLGVTQEMGARMGAVTGKGFGGLIREKFGARWAAFAILIMLCANLGTTVAEFAGIAASLSIFNVSRFICVPLAAAGIYFLIAKYDFPRVQRVFLFSSLVYFTYVISGILAKPDWHLALKNTFVPTLRMDYAYIWMFVATVGTTITPWGQFFIQSFVVNKRLKAEDLSYVKADVYVGAFFTDFIAFFIIVACAATVYKMGFQIPDHPTEAVHVIAKALQPLAGKFAVYLFAYGLLNASLLGAAIVPLTSAYATCETFGWESGVDKNPREAPIFFGVFLFYLVVPSAIVLLAPPHLLIEAMVLPQVLNGMLLPIILIFVLKITNDSLFMGKYTNSRIFNVISVITTIVMIILTIMLLVDPIIRPLILRM
jgi:NRAMP (natural resistance-associated macrophage protein)-like metal ion transporter